MAGGAGGASAKRARPAAPLADAPANGAARAPAPPRALADFLAALGLERHLAAFLDEEVDVDVLAMLDDGDLADMGVANAADRLAIMRAAERGKEGAQPPPSAGAKARSTHQVQLQLGVAGRLEKPPPTPAPAAKPHTPKEPAEAQQPPPWCMPLDGTRVVVDCFLAKHRRWLRAHFPPERNVQPLFFLTHFHSDHYGGLTKGFKEGTILCTHGTAQLVTRKAGVDPRHVRVLPLNTPTEIDKGITVTLVDANHCPGAAMLLFQLPSGRLVLHTGDMRYDAAAFRQNAHLAAAAHDRRRDARLRVVLDTTYAEPKHTFAPQRDLIDYVASAVEMEAFRSQSTLFLFGTYALGKERVVREVARRLKRKVCVSAAKKLVWECVFGDDAADPWWTTDANATNLHVCPIWRINLKNLAAELKAKRHLYSTVVAFAPTGWALGGKPGEKNVPRANQTLGVTREQKGSCIVYRVPYSEHSSFTELRDFVHWLKPDEILPHVGNDGGWRMQKMVRALTAPHPPSA